MKSWDDCLQALTDEMCRHVANTRGYPEALVFKLREQGLIGYWQGSPAFPISNAQGEVVGCHIRLPHQWSIQWFTPDPSQHIVTPLIMGEPSEAGWAFVCESQWDAFAILGAYGWHTNPDWLNGGCIVITRGAEGGIRLKGLLPPTCTVYAWKQNDSPSNKGKLPAADKWLEDVARYSGCQVRLVKTPEQHKDANDWLRAGATGNNFADAVAAAATVPPPPPEIKNERLVMPNWFELGLIGSEEQERKPFPAHTIPAPFNEVSAQIAHVNAVPEGLAASNVLAAISTSLGGALSVRLFRDKITRPNLYLAVALGTGEGKSTTFDPFFKPLLDLEADRLENWRTEIYPRAKAQRDVLRKEIEKLQGQVKGAKTQEAREQFVAQIAQKENEAASLEGMLVEPALIVEDITTEMLAVRLKENGESLALVSSDGGDVVANIVGRYRKDDAVDDNLYVKGYSGDPVKVSRLNRPSIVLQRPCLSVILLVQPDKLVQLLAKRRLVEGGLMPRFLMTRLSCPPSHVTADRVEIPSNVLRAYNEAIQKLATTFRLGERSVVVDGTRAARQVIADYHNRIADRRGSDLKDISGFAARWHEQACRLAPNLHAAKYLAEAGRHEVEESIARDAVEIAEWYAAEQLAILQSSRNYGLEQTLTAIWRVASTSADGFTARDLQRKRMVEDQEQATTALGLMVAKGLLAREEQPTGGRPTTVYKLKR